MIPNAKHWNFDKRDSLKREKAYKREVSCAFRLVSQAAYATLSEDILEVGALRAYIPLPLIEFDCSCLFDIDQLDLEHENYLSNSDTHAPDLFHRQTLFLLTTSRIQIKFSKCIDGCTR
jgi:hypothetical protein